MKSIETVKTGLFFAALPFRKKLYLHGGWPNLAPSADPVQMYREYLLRFFTKQELRFADDRSSRYIDLLWRGQFDVVLNSSDEYPPLLRSIFDAPAALFCKGRRVRRPAYISLVGTRYPDRITIEAVDRFIVKLKSALSIDDLYTTCIQDCIGSVSLFGAKHNKVQRDTITTVSGFALGVDERVHRASIYQQIPTVAVLGSGISTITPVSNRYLIDEAESMDTELSFVSEFFPDEPSRRFAYPRRNRIIAGMSSLCIVFQAGPRSGALITARFAIDEGRDVVVFDDEKLDGIGKNEGARLLAADGAGRLAIF